MGSFNLQCAITRETIGEGDKVVSFMLEPVLNEHGNVNVSSHIKIGETPYVISSLPVHGRYGDYGRVERLKANEEPLDAQIAVNIAKALYDYDYSEEAVENYSDHFAKGGGQSYFDTNTLHWVIKQEAYDALWSEIDTSEIEGLIGEGKISEAFKGKIDKDLLQILQDLKGEDRQACVSAAQLIKAFEQLGKVMRPEIQIASQFAGNDTELRKAMHASLKNAKRSDSEALDAPVRYTCLVTGNALAPGDKVMAIPLVSKTSVNGTDQIGHMNLHRTAGMYQVLSSPIGCVVKEDGSIDAVNMSKRQFNWTMNIASSDEAKKIPPREGVNALLSGKYSESRYGDEYPLAVALISDIGYKSIGMKKSDTLKKEYAVFKKAAEVFDKAVEVLGEDPVRARQIFEESDTYSTEGLDFIFDYLIRDLNDEDKIDMRNVNIGRAFKDSYHAIASSLGDARYDKNYFMATIMPGDSEGFLSGSLRMEIARIMVHNDTGKLIDIAKRFEFLVDELQEPYSLISNLYKNGLGLNASCEYQGDLTVREQRKLNASVRQPAIDASLEALREFEQECGY